jgi:hypothetical protein
MQSFGEMLAYVQALPLWASHLIASLVLVYTMVMAGIVVAKTGRSFMWALLIFLPYVGYAGIILLSRLRWPREPASD